MTLSGTPPGGATALTLPNGCSAQDYCAGGKLQLDALAGSNLLLIVTSTDAVGHTQTALRYFQRQGLREALVGWRDAIPQSSDVQAAQSKLDGARAALNDALAGFDAGVLGNITLATQAAQSSLLGAGAFDQGLNLTPATTRGEFLAEIFVSFMQVRLDGYVAEHGESDTFTTAGNFVTQAKDGDDIGTILNLLANAFFWMEDGANPMEAVNFAQTQSLLGRIITELDTYVTYDPALTAQSQLAQARTNLSEVKTLIYRVVDNGDTSLTDREHADLLVGLTDTAENLKESQGLGAWVRNWQWGLTLITYIYAYRGLYNAEDYLGSFNPVFIEGVGELNRANVYRGERRADDFMNLLINSRCLTIGIYNRAYDPDIDPPSACCDEMIRFQGLDAPFPVPRSCINQEPEVTNPGEQGGTVGGAVTLNIEATDADDDPLTYSATGLPAGLSIATDTGVISGTLTTADTYTVTVTVSDGIATDSVTFTWTVRALDLDCRGGADKLSTSPGGDMLVCDDPTDQTCEQDFGSLCPTDWHLCTSLEFNARNDGWNFPAPTSRSLGVISCRSSGAGHFTVPTGSATVLSTDQSHNCWFGSSRASCTSGYGCNERGARALCCAPQGKCGNGQVDHPEEHCDDGNDDDTDECLSNCAWRRPAVHGLGGIGCN